MQDFFKYKQTSIAFKPLPIKMIDEMMMNSDKTNQRQVNLYVFGSIQQLIKPGSVVRFPHWLISNDEF